MRTIFYSWQSDRHKATCRNLIERALGDAIQQLVAGASIANADRPDEADDHRPDSKTFPGGSTGTDGPAGLILDKDTQGVPGSPPIAETIFEKIEQAAVFVPDLTFVSKRPDERPSSNPNVLIEYGWALKALGNKRILPVMNTAYGAPDAWSLPFDMIHVRHPITFSCREGATTEERSAARKELAKQLRVALQVALKALDANEPPAAAGFKSPYDSNSARFRGDQPIGSLHDSFSALRGRPAQQLWLKEGPSMWLRVWPHHPLAEEVPSRRIQESLHGGNMSVSPLNCESAQGDIFHVRGADGYGLCMGLGEDEPRGRTAVSLAYVFTSGEVWSIDTYYLTADPNRLFLETKAFATALHRFAALLRRLGASGPYHWIAGIEGVANRRYAPEGHHFGGEILKDRLIAEGEYSGRPDDAMGALKPFFDAVSQAAHLPT